MKKCILSAVGGALAMLITLIIIANICVAREQKQEKKPYEHVDFVDRKSTRLNSSHRT